MGKQVYNKDMDEMAYRLCLLGLTDKELAVVFGVSEDAIMLWRRKYKSFAKAVKLGRQQADANVARALYLSAIGYSHDDEYITVYKGQPIRIPIRKHYPPNTTAAIFWLKNRTRDNETPWADIKHVEHSGKLDVGRRAPVDLSDLSEEELKLIAKVGFKVSVEAEENDND